MSGTFYRNNSSNKFEAKASAKKIVNHVFFRYSNANGISSTYAQCEKD
jgi:hypothetical protein